MEDSTNQKQVGVELRLSLVHLTGLISLLEMSKRLGEDHSNAQVIAKKLASSEHLDIDPSMVRHPCTLKTLPLPIAQDFPPECRGVPEVH